MSPFLDQNLNASPVYVVGKQAFIPLATGIASLAASASTTPVLVKTSGTYAFSVIMSGTTPSLKLQALGVDGTTWTDIVTVTANGSATIDIFAGESGAYLRVANSGSNPITALTSSLVA